MLSAFCQSGGDRLDTQRSMYYELGKGYTYYVRILRLSYTQSMNREPSVRVGTPVTLSYRTFMPYQVTCGGTFSEPDFEPQTETQKRAMAWLSATGGSCAESLYSIGSLNNIGFIEIIYGIISDICHSNFVNISGVSTNFPMVEFVHYD